MKTKVTSGAIGYLFDEADNNSGFVKKRDTLLVSVTKPRNKKQNALPKSRKKYIKEKAEEVQRVVGITLGNELEKEVLSHVLTTNYDLAVCEKYNGLVCDEGEMLGVTYQAGFRVPTSVVCSITKNYNRLLIDKNLLVIDKPVVGQLQKKMGQLEMSGTVPIKIEQVACFITKTDSKTVVFYYIENVPLLMERLVAGCLLDNKFEESFMISKFKQKIMFKIGADRGGSDLINEIALINRHNGNSGRYSIPIGVVEGATEIHSNMVKTIYSPARKEVLEQLVNQHLWMVRIYFYHTDRSTMKDVKCCLLRLKGIERKKLSETKFVCTIDSNVSSAVAANEWTSNANDRSIADSAFVNLDMFTRYVF